MTAIPESCFGSLIFASVLIVIFPIFALITVQITGVIWFTPLYTFVLGIAIGLVDVGVLRVAVSLFQRESILVRWR